MKLFLKPMHLLDVSNKKLKPNGGKKVCKMKAKKILVTLMVMAMSVSCIACSDKDTSKGIAKSMLGIEADSSSDEGKTSDETSEKDENNKESSGMEEEVIEDSSEVNDESDNASENNGDLTSEDNWKPVDIKDVETLFAFAPMGNYDESIIEILFDASEISYDELVKYQNFNIHEYKFSDKEEERRDEWWVHAEGEDKNNRRILLEKRYINDTRNKSQIVEKADWLHFYSNDQENIKTEKTIVYVDVNRRPSNIYEGISKIYLTTSFNSEAEAQQLFDRLSNAMSQSEGKFKESSDGEHVSLTRENMVGNEDQISFGIKKENENYLINLYFESHKWKIN